MATPQNLTDFNDFLREWFVTEAAEVMSFRNAPLVSWLMKECGQDGAGGSKAVFPLVWALGGGTSATFSSTQSDTNSAQIDKFSHDYMNHYTTIQLDRKSMMATTPAGKKAIMTMLAVALEAKTRSWKENLNVKLYRNGTGSRGQRASISSNIITLAVANDANNFEVGQKIVAASSETGALRTGSAIVTKVTRPFGTATAGKVEVDNAAGITSFADNDYLFVSGDAHAGASYKCPWGLDALFPTADPGGLDSFGGINRSQDPVRLAGVRVDGTGLSVRDALINLVEDTLDIPSAIFTHPNVIKVLKASENNALRYTEVKSMGNAKLSFKGVEIETSKGAVPLIGDRHCFANRAYALHGPTLTLAAVNSSLPDIVNGDQGNQIIMPSDDGYEIRLTGYLALGSRAPGNNGVAFNLGV